MRAKMYGRGQSGVSREKEKKLQRQQEGRGGSCSIMGVDERFVGGSLRSVSTPGAVRRPRLCSLGYINAPSTSRSFVLGKE